MEKMNRPLQKQFKDFPQGQRADRSMRQCPSCQAYQLREKVYQNKILLLKEEINQLQGLLRNQYVTIHPVTSSKTVPMSPELNPFFRKQTMDISNSARSKADQSSIFHQNKHSSPQDRSLSPRIKINDVQVSPTNRNKSPPNLHRIHCVSPHDAQYNSPTSRRTLFQAQLKQLQSKSNLGSCRLDVSMVSGVQTNLNTSPQPKLSSPSSVSTPAENIQSPSLKMKHYRRSEVYEAPSSSTLNDKENDQNRKGRQGLGKSQSSNIRLSIDEPHFVSEDNIDRNRFASDVEPMARTTELLQSNTEQIINGEKTTGQVNEQLSETSTRLKKRLSNQYYVV